MHCPKCNSRQTVVVLTKEDRKANSNIRRRACRICEHRWYTVELVLPASIQPRHSKATDSYTCPVGLDLAPSGQQTA